MADLTGAETSARVPARVIASVVSLANLSAEYAITAAGPTMVAIGDARRLGTAFALFSVGKTGLAVILMGVGVILTIVGSGSQYPVNRGEALRIGGPTVPALRANQPPGGSGLAVKTSQRAEVPIDGPPKSKADSSKARVTLAQLLDEARKSAGDLNDARSRTRMFLAIAQAQIKAVEEAAARASLQQATQTADTIEGLSNRVRPLEDIAVAQVDSHDRDAALATMRNVLKLISMMGDEHERNSVRMGIVRTFSRAGDLDTALQIVRELPVSGMCRARALANALGGLKQSDQPAARLFMPSFLMMAEELGDRTRWAECMGFIAEVLTDADDVSDLIMIADKFEMAMSEFGLGDTRREHVLDGHVLTLFALAKATAKAGKRDDSIATFNKAAALASMLSESVRSDRLGRLVRDRVGAGDIDGALETCELITYEYHKALSRMSIAEAQAKIGLRDDAKALFQKAIATAREIKIRDNLRDRPGAFELNASECLRTIAFVQARAGFSAEAIQTAAAIGEPKWKDSAFSMIAATMASQGQIRASIQLAARIDGADVKSAALQGIALGQAESGDIAGAVEWARSRATPRARADAFFGIVQAIAKR